MVVGNEKNAGKRGRESARNLVPYFYPCYTVRKLFFCQKMSKSFVFTPVDINIMRKQGRQRVSKILENHFLYLTQTDNKDR